MEAVGLSAPSLNVLLLKPFRQAIVIASIGCLDIVIRKL